jgi:vesicle-fusing ATPase
MKSNDILDTDVDLAELASLTKNFSGAEISGLIKSASSFAFNRHVKVGTLASTNDDLESLKVCRADFLHALDEVKPSFGVAENEMKGCVMNGVISYSTAIDVSDRRRTSSFICTPLTLFGCDLAHFKRRAVVY